MGTPLRLAWMAEQDETISAAVAREGSRLRSFIRRRVPDEGDVEDILQEVYFELVEASRLMKPIEQVGAWMFRVARNRIADLFRKQGREAGRGARRRGELGGDAAGASAGPGGSAGAGAAGPRFAAGTDLADDGERLPLVDLLPSPDAGPEAAYARGVLLDELDAALDELPAEQREVFIAHELEGRSFKQLAAESGVNINTLLARKHYAVQHLRRRLRAIYDEFVEE
jgi:RNA polymerase sigma factor (sigma-70 family)